MPRRFAPRQFLTIHKSENWRCFLIDVRTFFEQNPNKEASPATARQARHTQKNTLCSFHFARARFLFLLMKRVFSAVFCLPSIQAGGGTGLNLISQRKSGIPPNPPSAFPLLKRNGNGSRRAKIPSPNPLPFARLLGLCPKTFRRTEFEAVFCKAKCATKEMLPLTHPTIRGNDKELPFFFTISKYFGNIIL